MFIFKRIKTFLLLDNKTKSLYIEAIILLGWARILKSLPFSKVAPLLGKYMEETCHLGTHKNQVQIKKISNAIHIMSRYTLWESQCLVKAIAGIKMLEKRNIESTLYLGIAKNKEGQLIAHAWLRSGSIYVSGSEEMDKFTVVGMYANNK